MDHPKRYEPKNPIIAPRIREADPPRDSFRVRFYGIGKTVAIMICYDRAGPPVLIESSFSHHLLRELFEAAKHKATITSIHVNGEPVSPSSIARTNTFVSQPGWSKPTTFRGWRRGLRNRDNGIVMCEASTAWKQFEQIVNLVVYNFKTPARK